MERETFELRQPLRPLTANQTKLVRTTSTFALLRSLWLRVSRQDPSRFDSEFERLRQEVAPTLTDAFGKRMAMATLLANMLDQHGRDALALCLEELSLQITRQPGFREQLKRAVKAEGWEGERAEQALAAIHLPSSTRTPTASPSPAVKSTSPTPSLLATPSPAVKSPTPSLTTPSPGVKSPTPSLAAPSGSPAVKSPTPSLATPSPGVMTKTPTPALATPSPAVKTTSPTPSLGIPSGSPAAETNTPTSPLFALPEQEHEEQEPEEDEEHGEEVMREENDEKSDHVMNSEAEADFCAAKDEIRQYVESLRRLAPDLAVFASHTSWLRYVEAHSKDVEALLQTPTRNTPECRRVVEQAQRGVNELTRLLEQAYVNMMRYEAQNTINSFANPSEYEQFMLSLALPMLPATVSEAEKLSKMRVVVS